MPLPHTSLVAPAFAVLSVAIVSLPAEAIDCGRAKTGVETTICGDPTLKAQDATLSRFYFDTLRTLHGDRHELLIADQRHWLAGDRACESRAATTRAGCLAQALAARQRAIAICFAGAETPAQDADKCPIFMHSGCPKITASASARLAAYPWLIEEAVFEARRGLKSFDCQPASPDAAGSPDDNETDVSVTLVAERPGLVAVRYESDGTARGAAHPWHDARLVTYDTSTKAEIGPEVLMPALKPGSQLLVKLSAAAESSLDAECCDDGKRSTFEGLGLTDSAPMPSGWAPAPGGGLTLGYIYSAFGRSFLATARLPRQVFIGAVDRKYAAAFP